MFTGLVEGRGIVSDLRSEGAAVWLVVQVPDGWAKPYFDEQSQTLSPSAIGDSVAINGCCLTIVEIDGARWSFQASPETLAKSNLGRLEIGHAVNLERSLPVNGRLGGHFVQGHVDGVGTVERIDEQEEWITMWFAVSNALAQLMVPKGSVSVDGVSLTVVDVEANSFSVALIPHTLDVTTLGARKVGDAVNIETDILGKYVQKLLNLQPSDS